MKIDDIEFCPNEEAKKFSFYRTEGFVKGAFYPKDENQLLRIYDFLNLNNMSFKVVGNGSNLLFSERGNEIFILSTTKMKKTLRKYGDFVFASAPVSLHQISLFCHAHALSGMEELSSVPASLGGALRMNAGAFGKEIFDNVEKVKVYKNNKVCYLKSEKIEKGYRYCSLEDCLILGAKLRFVKANKCDILKKQTAFNELRMETQPHGFCCGSVFKNPPHMSAGALIENCSLKGFSIGGAKVSTKHANFIINENCATSQDIIDLIEVCKHAVKEKFLIDLECEIEII